MDFFPERSIKKLSDCKRDLTIKDCLTNTTGCEWGDVINTEAISDTEIIRKMCLTVADWTQFCLDREIVKKPGTFFTSNSPVAQLLASIIKKVTGKSPYQYAKEKLFNPLGIDDVTWLTSLNDENTGAQGLSMKPRDIAKLGLLYLTDGVWDDAEILTQEWVNESTSIHCQTRESHKKDKLNNYGYQWFISSGLPYYTYCAYGIYGQFIFIVKELDLIFATTGNIPIDKYKLLLHGYLKNYVIPSCNEKNGSLCFNRDSYSKLQNIVYNIEHPKFDNYKDLPDIANKISFSKYIFKKENTFIFLENISNSFKVKSIFFDFISNKACQVIIETFCNNYFDFLVSLNNLLKTTNLNSSQGEILLSVKGEWVNDIFIMNYFTEVGIKNSIQMTFQTHKQFLQPGCLQIYYQWSCPALSIIWQPS